MSHEEKSGQPIELYYDVVCPYARLGYYRVAALAAAYGRPLHLKPVLLGGLFQAHEAPQVPASTWGPSRQAYILQDILWSSARAGRPVEMPAGHPQRTVSAMRLLTAASAAQVGPLSEALFEAYWTRGLDVTDRAVLAELAAGVGLSIDVIDDPAVKDALRDNTAAAAARGMFGVPTVVYGDQMWWGQDRLHFLEAALAGHPVEPAVRLSNRTGRPVRFFHDFSSPFSYLAATQISAIARRHGSPVEWTPILLGALFKQIGTADVPLFTFSEARQQAFIRDAAEWARWWGVDFTFPANFPLRSVLPLRVAILCPEATLPLYRAYWAEGRDISDAAVVKDVLLESGLDAGVVDRAEEARDVLKANTALAVEKGVFGLPTFVVEDEVLIWGQDRLFLLEDVIAGWSPAIETPTPPRVYDY